MTPKEYKQVREKMGQDALHAILFFFVGVPLFVTVVAWVLMS